MLEIADFENIVTSLGQDKVDNMDWDLIYSRWVEQNGSLRTKKQLQEKWRNYLKVDVKLNDGERFVFSREQVNYIMEQRNCRKRGWSEIREDLNKEPSMTVKTTPNRVKNAYHNETKKRLRLERQNLPVNNEMVKAVSNVDSRATESYGDSEATVDSEATDSTDDKGPD
ncbi:5014_t:CDS:2 [Scutellospora calospora]|uniref:5014_t:CDS:1 n=1 Tax=Scutellospora calospora TaxID=85575 RepID=A0ACA9K1B1_9GLOM|nr:5014_t:CDS:2 [Scutellospora calospora]